MQKGIVLRRQGHPFWGRNLDGGETRPNAAISIPHGSDLCFELGVALHAEVSATFAALPGPGFVLLLGKDDHTAHLLSWDPMQSDRDELTTRGHRQVLYKN